MQSLIPVLHNHAGKEKFLYMQLPQINLTNIALLTDNMCLTHVSGPYPTMGLCKKYSGNDHPSPLPSRDPL